MSTISCESIQGQLFNLKVDLLDYICAIDLDIKECKQKVPLHSSFMNEDCIEDWVANSLMLLFKVIIKPTLDLIPFQVFSLCI